MVQNPRFKRCAQCQCDAKGSSRDVGRPWVRVGKPRCQVSVSNFNRGAPAYHSLVPLQIMPHDVYLITDTRYSQNYKILHLPSQYMITGYHVHHVARLLPNRINDIFLINDSRHACFYKNRHLLTMNKYRLFWHRFS